MKISVLGTEYTIEYRNKIQDVLLNDCDGYCDKTSKCIVIGEKENDSELSDFDQYQRKVLRYEIIHAFLFESGLHESWQREQGHNESYVDWIAVQYPKMKKVFAEAGCDD